jgi:acetyl esterase/lipase
VQARGKREKEEVVINRDTMSKKARRGTMRGLIAILAALTLASTLLGACAQAEPTTNTALNTERTDGTAGDSNAETEVTPDVTTTPNGETTAPSSVTLAEALEGESIQVDIKRLPITAREGIAYKEPMGASNLYMDVLIPAGQPGTTFPLIVFIQGGGFMYSEPAGSLQHRMALAEAGYVVASVQHRVVPAVRFPEPLIDCKAAVRYLRAHAAEYSIDPTRVGAMGNSSGGYFATMLGVTGNTDAFDSGDFLDQSSSVMAVVDLYGVYDLDQIGTGLSEDLVEGHNSPATSEALLINGTAFADNKGASVFDTPEATAAGNPSTYIDAADPPFLIFHGDQDTLVSPVATKLLYDRLAADGIPAQRYIVPGAGHGTPEFLQDEIVEKIVAFFDQYLKS